MIYVFFGWFALGGTTDLTGCGDFSADQINIFVLFPEPIAHAMPRPARGGKY